MAEAPLPLPQVDLGEGDPGEIVLIRTKGYRRDPFNHHWLEVETSQGKVAFGFGPATVPFIDAGQIGLQDELGNIERYSGGHPIQPLTLPPIGYDYAPTPGAGKEIGRPIAVTRQRADELIQDLRRARRVNPYVPLFNDCRTFVCRVRAKLLGKSALPCHFLFKGYW